MSWKIRYESPTGMNSGAPSSPPVTAARILNPTRISVITTMATTVGRWLPSRFVLFAAVGSCGLLIHLGTLRAMLLGFGFPVAQATATSVAMLSNFTINNALTYRDRRLRGLKFVGGLLTFCAVCGIGAIANVRLASAAFEQHYEWWLSGLAGAAASVVWNYAVTSIFTWRK